MVRLRLGFGLRLSDRAQRGRQATEIDFRSTDGANYDASVRRACPSLWLIVPSTHSRAPAA
jgi:hypothetical protein